MAGYVHVLVTHMQREEHVYPFIIFDSLRKGSLRDNLENGICLKLNFRI